MDSPSNMKVQQAPHEVIWNTNNYIPFSPKHQRWNVLLFWGAILQITRKPSDLPGYKASTPYLYSCSCLL